MSRKAMLLSYFSLLQIRAEMISVGLGLLRSPLALRQCCRPISLRGVFPPITTPFDRSEQLNFAALKTNLDAFNKESLAGYAVLGSNGECSFLSEAEKLSLVSKVKSLAYPQRLIIVGTGGIDGTAETIRMCKEFKSAGADVILAITPNYFKGRMTPEALLNHYQKVADSSPIPLCLYNVPANTGVELDAATVVKLASHPNVIGMKDSGGDIVKISQIAAKTAQLDFQLLAGSAGFFLPALLAGCVGTICALANLLGPEIVRLQQLHDSEDLQAATSLQARLIGPNNQVTRRYGVSALKVMLDRRGLYGGVVRSPLLPLTTAEEHLVVEEFVANGFPLTTA